MITLLAIIILVYLFGRAILAGIFGVAMGITAVGGATKAVYDNTRPETEADREREIIRAFIVENTEVEQ